MKKLFYILPEYSAEMSTHFRYNVELLEELAKEMEVTLFIERGEKPKVSNIQNVQVQKYQFLPLRLLERFWVFFKARISGYRHFYSHYSYFSALIAGVICRFTFGRMYFWHCEMRKEYEESGCFLCNLPAKLSRDWPYRAILKLAYRLVTCTPRMKQYYKEEFNVPSENIEVISNWINVEELARQAARAKKYKKPTILFVHWLSPRKGTQILPDLFEEVRSKMPEVQLVVVGEGPDFRWLNRQWRKRGLEKHVKMIGAVPNKDIPKWFGKAHILLHPSREEEFGRVQIEAMACSMPIVATTTFGSKSVLSAKQKRWLFNYEKPKKGADLCVKLLQSDSKRAKLAEEGLRHVKNFDKSKIVQRFLELFVS